MKTIEFRSKTTERSLRNSTGPFGNRLTPKIWLQNTVKGEPAQESDYWVIPAVRRISSCIKQADQPVTLRTVLLQGLYFKTGEEKLSWYIRFKQALWIR